MAGKHEQLLTEADSSPVGPGVATRRSRLLISPTLWALVAALVLAALYGRVALLNLGVGVVGGDLDGYENLWNDHWVRTALLDLHRNPFFTDYLYYPTGISLRYHTLNPLNGLFAIPLWPLLGSVATTNLKFLLSMALTTFCAYLLFKDLTGHALGAFAGAAVFTYANDQLYGFYSFGQAEKLAAWWFPLYLCFMYRTLHRPRWGRYIAASVLTLLAMSLTDWQYVLYAVIVTIGYFGFSLFTRQIWAAKRLLFFKLAGIGLVWLGIVWFPLLWPMLIEARDNPWLAVSDQAGFRSRALSQFFEIIPGSATRPLGNPGYLVLGLTLAGLFLLWRGKPGVNQRERELIVFWAIAAGLASLLTLGPRLKLVPGDEDTGIPMPYALLYKLPILNIGRDPERFYIIALIGFGLLLAFVLRQLLPLATQFVSSRLARLKLFSASSGKIASGLISGLLVFGILAITLGSFVVKAGEVRVDPPDWPAFYYELAKDNETYAIMELPLFAEDKGRGEDTYEAYQSIHGKPRLGGRLARDHKLTNPNNFTKQATLFRDFFWATRNQNVIEGFRPSKTPDLLPTPDYKDWGLPLLNYYKVRYIILYPEALRDTGPQAFGAAQTMVKRVLGEKVQPVYQDAKLIAYRVPDAPTPIVPVFIDLASEGWYTTEKNPTAPAFRWVNACNNNLAESSRQFDKCENRAGELLVFNLSQKTRRTRIQFTTFNYQQPRDLKIAINGFQAESFRLEAGASREVSLELDIPPGLNKLTIASPQPPVPVNQKDDNRLLSFGLNQVRLNEIGTTP